MSWASGRTALVTGGNSGVGRVLAHSLACSCARLLAARGANLRSRPEAP